MPTPSYMVGKHFNLPQPQHLTSIEKGGHAAGTLKFLRHLKYFC